MMQPLIDVAYGGGALCRRVEQSAIVRQHALRELCVVGGRAGHCWLRFSGRPTYAPIRAASLSVFETRHFAIVGCLNLAERISYFGRTNGETDRGACG